MKITIMHLYYDLLNLYGESGNIKAIKNTLEELNIDTFIKFTTLDEEIKLDNVDLLYIGMGTVNNQKLALNHIKKYQKEIENYIKKGGFVLATGNALELFGKKIKYLDEEQDALNIFPFTSEETKDKITSEILAKTLVISKPVIGFTNRTSIIKEENNYLFDIIKGKGNNLDSKKDGYFEKNFYGTYLIGPLLVRNPDLLNYFIKQIIKNKYQTTKIKKINLSLEKKAYQEFLNNYYKEYI